MPPKGATKKSAQAAPSASQPLPEKATRASTRKRRLSETSVVSAPERPSSSQSQASAGASKRQKKRGRPAKSSASEALEVVEEKADELDAQHQALECGGDATADPHPHPPSDSIDVTQQSSKQVHFGSDAQDVDTSTATMLTPHPSKTSIKHRISHSPSGSATKRVRTTISRSSLPGAYQENDGTQQTEVEYVFTPLKEVLEARMRRILLRRGLSQESIDDNRTGEELEQLVKEAQEKDERIRELIFQLETQRHDAIATAEDEASLRALEEELAALKRELSEHILTHRLEQHITIEPDDQMPVLDRMEEVEYPALPTPRQFAITPRKPVQDGEGDLREPKASGRMSLTQATNLWDEERRNFQDAIVALSAEANDAKAKLQIFQIELRGLGFGDADTHEDHLAILASIRQSHTAVREFLDEMLPDTVPENATTQDIIEILIANTNEFIQRLRAEEQKLQGKDTLITELGNQINGLLEHLAESKIRCDNLEKQWRELDQRNEEDVRTIEDLEEELRAERDAYAKLEEELEAKQEEAKTLGQDHAEAIKNLEKLNISLENYHKEENKLTELISRMEEEHRATISKMAKEREETVQDLEARLDAETALRMAAEQQADERQTEITRLELQNEETSTALDSLRIELETAKAELEQARENQETAEADLEEKGIQIEDLEARVERLEEDLDALNSTLEELRMLNETEREQREAAERDLDDRNLEIEQLNERLQKQGKEANELRLKLHEVQQKNAEKVAELETQASERDERYQADIAEEVGRREGAEKMAQERAATIMDLQSRIEDIELQMRNDLAERDERIQELEDELAQKNLDMEKLRGDLASVENELVTERANFEERREELTTSITALQETIGEHEATIRELEAQQQNMTELHSSEIEDREAQNAELNAQIETLKAQQKELEQEKAGLERRVEQEATQMLEFQNQIGDETDRLKKELANKHEKILVVEEKARQADERWQEVLDARDEEIVGLKQQVATQEETTTTLRNRATSVVEEYKDYVRRSSDVIRALQDQITAAKNVADEEGGQQIADGNAVLAELEAMDVDSLVAGSQNITVKSAKKTVTSQSSAAGGKKGRGRKSKRGTLGDSGIGLDGQMEEDAEAVAQ
jgi:hypothetical protein